MTEQEKEENDRCFDAWIGKHANEPDYIPFNPGHKFNCPICGEVREVRRNEYHKFFIMNDGEELQQY